MLRGSILDLRSRQSLSTLRSTSYGIASTVLITVA